MEKIKFFGSKENLKEIIENNTSWKIEENIGNIDLRITTNNGMIFNFFSGTKSISSQGNENSDDLDKIKSLLEIKATTSEFVNSNNKRIFIVHGSDEISRLEIKDILHEWGLKPIVSGEQPSNGGNILGNLLDHIKSCSYGIVLLTPDDIGYKQIEGEKTKQPRARQNVLIELGMLIQYFGSQKMVILRKSDTEIPTDINGLIYRPFDKSIKEIKADLLDDLKNAGILK